MIYEAWFDWENGRIEDVQFTVYNLSETEAAKALASKCWSPTKLEAVKLLYAQEKKEWEQKLEILTKKMGEVK